MLEPRMRPWHTSPGVILPRNSLLAPRSWHDNHTAISSCCPPISEPCDGHYSAQKATGYFLLVPDWFALHQIKKVKSLIYIISKKSVHQSFVSFRSLLHRPPKERSFMLTQNILRASYEMFLICTFVQCILILSKFIIRQRLHKRFS